MDMRHVAGAVASVVAVSWGSSVDVNERQGDVSEKKWCGLLETGISGQLSEIENGCGLRSMRTISIMP